MSLSMQQTDDSNRKATEDLIRSLDQVPEIPSELRSRVLMAATQTTRRLRRRRAWIATSATVLACATCTMIAVVMQHSEPAGTVSEAGTTRHQPEPFEPEQTLPERMRNRTSEPVVPAGGMLR